MNIVEVNNLTKKYHGKIAVDNLSFSVKKGEIVGLLGPNGSGKSTTINCILSLLNYEGRVNLFGEEMNPDKLDIKSKIGAIFQDVAVFEELSVYENIDFFAGLYEKNKVKRKALVAEALKIVNLEEASFKKPSELSGGMLRRLNIACGIVHHPELIIFDEPTVGVDPQSRNAILDFIKSLKAKGSTIIYTTHYMEEAEYLCDRIIIIDKGHILAEGSLSDLIKISGIHEKVILDLKEHNDGLLNYIKSLDSVESVTTTESLINIRYKDDNNNLTKLIKYLDMNNITYKSIYSEKPNLNDVFLKLTGKELRD